MLQPLELHSGYQKAEHTLAEEKASRQGMPFCPSQSQTGISCWSLATYSLNLGWGCPAALEVQSGKLKDSCLLTARRLSLSGVLGVGETLYNMDCSQPRRQIDSIRVIT